jgi:hypothetical protein
LPAVTITGHRDGTLPTSVGKINNGIALNANGFDNGGGLKNGNGFNNPNGGFNSNGK